MTDPADSTAQNDPQALLAEIESLKAELMRFTDLAARAQADLLNFKDRMKREGEELRKFAIVPLLLRLLPIRDDLVRMVAHESTTGCRELLAKIDALLQSFHVEPIDAFNVIANPDYHEIINTAAGKKDVILAVHEEGFLLHGKVLRPSKVMVGDGTLTQ